MATCVIIGNNYKLIFYESVLLIRIVQGIQLLAAYIVSIMIMIMMIVIILLYMMS